jgi:iron complex transport system ATP-binding protein
MRTLSGFQAALSGEVRLDGRALGAYAPHELSERVGVVLTERESTPDLTVEEVVAIGRMPYTNFWGTLRVADRKAVDEAIALVGIGHLRHKKIGCVSDGERQKTMIAKALAQQTPMILMDEPSAFLDFPSKVELMLLLRELADTQGKAILLSTHDVGIALKMADELWLMQDQNMTIGTPQELLQSGKIDSFLGESKMYV